MPREKTIDEVYNSCESDGFFRDKEIEIDRIQTMVQLSDTILETVKEIKKDLDVNSAKWSIVYSMYYDVLRRFVEIFIGFDKKKIANHQCLFSYLCKNYSELELDWNFFEKVRTKRNGIHYYGSLATYNDFKEIGVQIELYIKIIKEEVKKRLKNKKD